MLYVNDSSRVWHVAKAGNDANSGHAGQYPVNLTNDAKLTIGAAAAAAASGDTIIIWPGTYSEQVNIQSKQLTLIGVKRHDVIITRPSSGSSLLIGSKTAVKNLTVTAPNPSKALEAAVGATDILLEDCDFIGTYDGAYLGAGGLARTIIRNCYWKGTYDGGNFYNINSVFCENTVFETDGTYSSSADFRGVHVGPGLAIFKNCIFIGARASSTGGIYGLDVNGGSNPTLVICDNCIFKAVGSDTHTGIAAAIRVQMNNKVVLNNCTFHSSGVGSSTQDIRQTSTGVVVVKGCNYSTTYGTITQSDATWANALASALFINGAANKLKIDADGRVDVGSLEGADAELLTRAAKMLLNKAVQDKLTGAIRYYDNDGQTVILTHTPNENASSLTRAVS
jgi:hypothetical protein